MAPKVFNAARAKANTEGRAEAEWNRTVKRNKIYQLKLQFGAAIDMRSFKVDLEWDGHCVVLHVGTRE